MGELNAYTDNVPLRMSTEWPGYPAVYALPVVYGRVTMRPQPYDNTGALWLIAGHAIQGIDSVSVSGQEIDGYALQNGVDDIGQPVSVLELANPVDDREKITISVRGKQHPVSGELLNRPDLVLHDWLVNVCGMSFAVSDFDDLRAWSQSNSVVVGGVVSEIESIQSATDRITKGMGLAWAADMKGVAMPWPPEKITPSSADELTYINSGRLESSSSAQDIVTVLNYSYADDWAEGKPGRSMVLHAGSSEQFGERGADVGAGWLQAPSAAEAHAMRWLSWYGAAVWRVEADTSAADSVGDPVAISHPYSRQKSGVVVQVAGSTLNRTVTLVSSELNAGNISIVSRSSGVDMEASSQKQYVYADGRLTYTVTDEGGYPISRATVTLDGATSRYTDNAGKVQFTVGRGSHTLLIEANGYIDQTVTVDL